MKKLFLFSIFMIFALLGLQAQNFKAGLLAGAVPSQVDGDNMSASVVVDIVNHCGKRG